MTTKVDAAKVLEYYGGEPAVEYYARAAASVGLWASEEKVFVRAFADRRAHLLELGCGAGRIGLGLWELGYERVLATDVSRKMVERARRLAKSMRCGVEFRVADALRLPFEENEFDGAIFGFNGLMQIPRRENRRRAMEEAHRVIRPGGRFVFTSHDREMEKWRKFWNREKKLWRKGKQIPELVEFGDRFEATELGELFIHVPLRAEVAKDLRGAGFLVELDCLRSQLANESQRVREFSDECRFWVCRKPGAEERS